MSDLPLVSPAPRSLIQQVWRPLLVAAALLLALAASSWLRPTIRLAEVKGAIDLERQVPQAFGEWRIDRSLVPVLPSPDVQAQLNQLYTQVLARTYVNTRGERVMLSIAYGSDQGSEATAVHRPEFCYSAQGFRVRDLGAVQLPNGGAAAIPARQLMAVMGPRIEPITYWVTLDETATVPGLGRKLAQLRYGLRGEIPDGMLMRVSSIARSDGDRALEFERHQAFVDGLRQAIAPAVRARYFGQ